MRKNKHTQEFPWQPLIKKDDERVRFQENRIVWNLLEKARNREFYDMTNIVIDFQSGLYTQGELVQFYQLIGYSIGGFCELSNVPENIKDKAELLEKEFALEKKMQYKDIPVHNTSCFSERDLTKMNFLVNSMVAASSECKLFVEQYMKNGNTEPCIAAFQELHKVIESCNFPVIKHEHLHHFVRELRHPRNENNPAAQVAANALSCELRSRGMCSECEILRDNSRR